MTSGGRSVDAVLVDFGGVVVPSPFAGFSRLEAETGLRPGLIRELNSRNPDTNAWARLERGEIDADRFCADFTAEAAELAATVDAAAVIAPLRRPVTGSDQAHPAMLDALDEARAAGVRTVLVTNDVVPMAGRREAQWVFDAVDAVIESCVVGSRKPDADFYRLALRTAGATATRTVMLDDLGINLKPARELGMRTIKVVDPAVAAAELRALLR